MYPFIFTEDDMTAMRTDSYARGIKAGRAEAFKEVVESLMAFGIVVVVGIIITIIVY